jgi:hypothetical protein
MIVKNLSQALIFYDNDYRLFKFDQRKKKVRIVNRK